MLTWFLHFHKAGGTTVVALARRNGEVLPDPNLNGCPLSADRKLNTDDWLGLEFSAPRGLLLDTVALNYRLLQRARTSPLPALAPEGTDEIERAEALYAIGLVPFSQLRWSDSLLWFRRAMDRDPGYTPAAVKAAQATLGLGRASEALALAQGVLAREPRNADALAVAERAATVLRGRS